MKAKQVQRIAIVLLGIVFAVDLTHGILNAIYRPFTGVIDNAMHLVIAIAPFVYGLTALCFAYAIVGVVRRRSFVLSPLILIFVLLAELAFTFLVAPRSGSSSYRPLFPDFLSGLLIGGLSVATAKPYMDSRLVRILLGIVFWLWLSGALISDALWYLERTERGTTYIWHIPVLANILVGSIFLVLAAGAPQSLLNLLGLRGNLPAINWAVGIALAFLIAWHLLRTHRGAHLRLVAVVLSIVFLMFKVTEWAAFFVD